MARPRKRGLDYFPFDVTFFSDPKIRRLSVRFGNAGRIMYLYLLCRIYENGYFIEENEDLILDAADVCGVSEELTSQLIEYLVSRSLLTRILRHPVTLITGESVQRRFQEAKKGAGRDIEVDEKIWILPPSETAGFIKVSSSDGFPEKKGSFSEKNEGFPEKNDTKKSKVKKSKVKESTGSASLDQALDKWFRYKEERMEPYPRSAMEAIAERLKSEARRHGDAAVVECIDEAICSGWKNLYFDKIKEIKRESYDLERAANHGVPKLKKRERS